MSSTDPHVDDAHASAPNPLRWRARFRFLGAAALAVGLFAATLIYAFADDAAPDAAAQIAGSRVYEYDIERIGGKSAVYAVRFNQWLASLWHGTTLAYTVAVIAIAVAAMCLLAARLATPHAPGSRADRIPADPAHDDDHEGPGERDHRA
ncbi:MAG TPA: hypothetical protein VGR63_10010 [Casimicrobiaceae bacterium]|nr:hypothetical protein [Casimicrobiaceae bacterium]